jgi:preprotein translocase subunit SecD
LATGNAPRPWRALAFVALVVIALYSAVFFGDRHTPTLGLDLRGGTSVTLTPRVVEAKGKISKSSLAKAVDIIRDRVNGFGVAEAEVVTEGNNIVVSVPGKGRSDVLKTISTTAQLRFRQVLQVAAATPAAPTPTASSTPKPSTSPTAKPSPSPTSNGRGVPKALAATPTPSAPSAAPTPSASPSPSANMPVPQSVQQRFATLDCSKPENRRGGGVDAPNEQVVACDADGNSKYLLAKAEVLGTMVKTATATIEQQSSQWQVQLDFNSQGEKRFGDLTRRVQPLPDIPNCSPPTGCNAVAIVLDNVVQSAPRIVQPILDGRAQITGNFTEGEARNLANVLRYGALPLAFDVSTAETISPTLGSDQLKAGLLAGAIGLALVILYSLVYYRGLGLVTIASLALSGLVIYAATTLLGKAIGYTLTLAGIAGFIVAVGITADSFVVYFERLRDEIREGRSLRSGAERAWVRARRTILSADTVSLLAAVVLYLFSIGGVRGFAFTLGLSTIVDLFVVFLFTKPLLSLLAGTRAFGSAGGFSGLGAGRTSRPASAGRPVPATTQEG